ncbi:sushi, von Willebrand factor type A, EGF and pentraxin domain-containing protein 1-like [Uloborus diversus]|uniref:sushi, von Willebrand factor type A, EGF and pentraxin domain-containing protein 1-like n=1 Tax=Uloborus diversus TaxID=327109 RepID=UPI00240A576A|nr:sushi, von Willebrand factor type A, EGF and pentraxin domain-containing protein 1-like [Uloborus diversus]
MINTFGKRTTIWCFLCVLFIPWIHSFSTDFRCGAPGRAPKSSFKPNKQSYSEGESVIYSCENDALISETNSRRCQRNGTWSGHIPKCYNQITINGAALVPRALESANAASSIDGNYTTCIFTQKTNESFWEGFVDPAAKIRALKITFHRKEPVNIKVVIKENITETICNGYSGAVGESDEERSIVMFCPKAAAGNRIYIIDLNQGLHNFRICEVKAYRPNGPHCLVPDYPLNGKGYRNVSARETKYRFQCDTGYELLGSVETTCGPDGTWSETTPICSLIYCRRPLPPNNGSILESPSIRKFQLGQRIHFRCDSGFELKGSPWLTCRRERTWSSPPPRCVSTLATLVKDCGKLPLVANGNFSSKSTTIGSTATLTCREGYTTLTSNMITCSDTGTWVPSNLNCRVIECERNPVVPHGRAILLDGSAYYGSRLQIVCNQGYVKGDPINRTCESSETWGDLSVCIDLSCGSPSFLSPIEGRWVRWNYSIPIRILECDFGYHIEGSPAITQCLTNGSWSYTSAACKRTPTASHYSNVSSPNLFLIIAVGVMTSTLCCCSLCFVVWRKRKQSRTSTTVFHDAMDDSSVYIPGLKENSLIQNRFYNKPTYDDVMELRPHSIATKPRSALPHLPVDADPVYAQPFETSSEQTTKQIMVTNKDDLYNAHIYAEPVDSRTPSSGTNHVPNCMAETWFRTGTGKFGRKMSLPINQSLSIDSFQEVDAQNEHYKAMCTCPTVNTSESTENEICQKLGLETTDGTSFRSLIDNSIYLEAENRNLPSHISLVRMISNEIYQDEQFSHV